MTTLVDAVNGLATLRARPESARQIALADPLVVAKSDLLPEGERRARLAELDAALRDLNPFALIVDGAAAEFGPAEFLAAPLSSPARSAGEGDHAIGRRSRPSSDGPWRGGGPSVLRTASKALLSAAPNPSIRAPSQNSWRWSARCWGRGSCASRACSLSPTGRRTPILVDGVQHVFHAPRALPGWPDADRSTRAVIIVEGVAARDVDNLWAALTRVPRIDAPDLAALTDDPLAPRAGGLLG